MPRILKLFAGFALFGLFCLCAAYLVSGVQRFEQGAEVAMFPDKAQMAAVAAAEEDVQPAPAAPTQTPPRVWK